MTTNCIYVVHISYFAVSYAFFVQPFNIGGPKGKPVKGKIIQKNVQRVNKGDINNK